MFISYFRLSCVILLLLVYFGYHIIGGQHGLLSWYTLDYRLSEAFSERKRLKEVESSLEKRVYQLSNGSLSSDLLIERVKEILGYAEVGETIIQVQQVT